MTANENEILSASIAGVTWLLNLQNGDGGIPTFCRGWTNLPFDRSAPDLTAHALRAWDAWLPELPSDLQRRVGRAIGRGVRYLARTQHENGAWLPLWFGNQHAPDDVNPVYGTARVLLGLEQLAPETAPPLGEMMSRGGRFLERMQREDGSWGGGENGPASTEETALAVEALAGLLPEEDPDNLASLREQVMKGANWLIEKVGSGEWRQPSPIGFYFAKLWYHERLYPQIFTVGALSRASELLSV